MQLVRVLVLNLLLTLSFTAAHGDGICDSEIKALNPQGARLSVPIERFIKPINELAKTLKDSTSLQESMDILVKSDGRGSLFQLEGLLKIYSEIYPEDIKPWKEKIKSLEDAFGQYTEKIEYLEEAQKLKDLPKEVLETFQAPVTKTRTALRNLLLKDKWLTKDGKMGSIWQEFKEDLKAQEWSSKEEDGDLFVEVVIDKMKEVRDSLDNNEYSPYKLQEGVHELRRQLRWFLIYFQAGNGLFKLIMPKLGMELTDYVYLINEPIAKSRFSKLPPNPRIDDPYTMPFHYFLALSMKVGELGAVKANSELFEVVVEGYLHSGLAKTKTLARKKTSAVFKTNDRPVTYASRAQKLMDEMVDSEMLRIIRKWLKVQLRGGDPLED